MKEATPPPELRNRIAKELRRAGYLRPARWPWAVAAALAIAISLAVMVHRTEPPPANYILLLYETATVNTGSRAEYSAWARKMRPLIVGGEELNHQTLLTINTTPASPRLAGYFLIHANDDDTAAKVAKACPHVKHGGGVMLRKIVM